MLLQLETASVSADVQLAVARHIFCGDDATNRSTVHIDGSSGILSSSLAYVTCWLSGQEFRASARRCGPRKSYRDPAFSAAKPDVVAGGLSCGNVPLLFLAFDTRQEIIERVDARSTVSTV